MTWSDEEKNYLIALALPLSNQEGVKQKNFKHWLKGYSTGMAFVTYLFTYDEVAERWKKINEK